MGKIFGKGVVMKEDVMKNRTTAQVAEDMNTIKSINNNFFKNKFVTPDMQQRFMQSGRSTTSIFDIINDPNFDEKFDRYEFPKFEQMNDGGVFFQPLMKVVSPMATRLVKFFSLTNEKEISNDHTYDYVRLREDGYLMKVEVSRNIDEIMGFEIKYLTPVMDVELSSIYIPNTSGASILDAQISAYKVRKYCVAQFNPAQHLELQEYYYHPELFIEEYLQDILEKDDTY